MRTGLVALTLAAGSLAMLACRPPADDGPERPIEPQAGTALREAVQAPQARARSAEAELEAAGTRQRDAIRAATGG